MKIIHHEITPENILFVDKKGPKSLLKLIHFGSSLHFDPHKKVQSCAGSAHYLAPEIFNSEGKEYPIHKCDLWSCGVLMHLLLLGHPPFEGKNNHEIIDNMKASEVSFESPEWKYVSPEAKDLVSKLL